MSIFVFFLILPLSNLVFGQAHMGEAGEKSSPKHGCQTIDVHCRCVNPTKNHTVKGQKVGRVNPGEPGECRPKLDIDEFLKEDALGYCMREGVEKDPRKATSKCTATWTCKKPCVIKAVPF